MTSAAGHDRDGCFAGMQVVLRCRPFNSREKKSGQKCIVTLDEQSNKVLVQDAQGEAPKIFFFNHVFGPDAAQQAFYSTSVTPLINGVLRGINGTFFAYGETGAGKTYTIEGYPSSAHQEGVIPRSSRHIFDHIRADRSRAYTVWVSYLEIYNEEMRDLLNFNGEKLRIRADAGGGVHVPALTQHVITGEAQLQQLMAAGSKHRTVQETKMGQAGRSHTVLVVKVDSRGARDDLSSRSATLSLVTLAASEPNRTPSRKGPAALPAQTHNRSLFALHNCISALADRAKLVPYRDSQLTRLLQDSLGGYCNTVLCCHVSPAEGSCDETLSTLRYGARASLIRNKPKLASPPPEITAPPPAIPRPPQPPAPTSPSFPLLSASPAPWLEERAEGKEEAAAAQREAAVTRAQPEAAQGREMTLAERVERLEAALLLKDAQIHMLLLQLDRLETRSKVPAVSESVAARPKSAGLRYGRPGEVKKAGRRIEWSEAAGKKDKGLKQERERGRGWNAQ